ncbi:hypothetical protein BDW22DRAFT_1359802 [Trametopsis cervina]|nr:hypothetical protein BDW22DRAFT_1359802 [Trametopsis cervina]
MSFSRLCLRTKIPLNKFPQASTSALSRCLHTSPPCNSAAVLTPSVELDLSRPTLIRRDPKEAIKWKKLEDFKASLEQEGFSRGRIPLKVHQKVLRRCTNSLAQAKFDLLLRMQRKEKIRAVHPYESRFQAIIYNIRQAGYQPSANDYHFILLHFAAVGQHLGALQVLREMSEIGLQRTGKAYGLCLQAMHRRLTLPIWHEARPRLAAGIAKLVFKMLKEMDDHKVPFTSRTIDLCFRIVGETLEDEPFERLMRLAYGIDLAYPDRPPLEFWGKDESSSASDASLPTLTPFPFTTAALNNTVEFLGRKGRISKLVQSFEVLTTPLPSSAFVSHDSSYMDDADEDFGDDHPEVAPFTPPHAEPNTETFETLIKWISQNNHAPLARHYLYQAYRHDRDTDRALRQALKENADFAQAPIPRALFTSGMLQSVFGLTNREKKIPMMRWTLHMLHKTKNNRRSDIVFYRRLEEKQREALAVASAEQLDTDTSAPEPPSPGSPEADDNTTAPVVEAIEPSVLPEDTSTSSSSTAFDISDQPESVVEDNPESSLVSKRSKAQRTRIMRDTFDINLHLAMLRREYSRLLLLEARMTDVVGRTTQRVKERLGRRVWASKDIYLRSQKARVLITKEQWRQSVNYRERRTTPEEDPEELAALGLLSPRTTFVKGMPLDFFTPSGISPSPKESSSESEEI